MGISPIIGQGTRLGSGLKGRRGIRLLPVVVVLVAVTTGCGLLEARETELDAGEMAEDPLLHLTLEGADPGEITARTGEEGGLIPAGQDRTSRAARTWTVDRTQAEQQLLAAVAAAAELEVDFGRLRCAESEIASDIRFSGAKQVEVGDDTVLASVQISLDIASERTEPSRSDLTLSLASDGTDSGLGRPPETGDPVTGDCPDEVLASFERSQD